MTTACAALLGSLLLAAPRVGVVAVGDDPVATGDLQRAIELRLSASRKVDVLGADALASVLPAPRPTPARTLDPALQKEAAALLQEASDAYYQDRAAVALDRLAALAALQDRTAAFPTAERVRLLLWRAAVFLALKDDTQAEAEALAALTLQPDLKVDLNEFKPSVKDAVDRVRARGFRTVTVLVSGLPSNATLELDDRPVSAPIRAAAGKHRLVARAPGRREVARVFEATADVSIPLHLPVATDPSTEAWMRSLAVAGEPTREHRARAKEIATKLRLDFLVVAVAGPESRAMVLAAGGSHHASPPFRDDASLAAWIDARLVGDDAPVAAASPTPRPGGTPVALAPTPSPRPVSTPSNGVRRRPSRGYAVQAGGGVLWSSRSRTLEGKDGGGFETSFGGVGPRVTVDASFGSPFVRGEAAWITYGISTLDVTLPDGSSATVDGGTTTLARLHGGWRQSFGSGGEPDARASVHAAAGVSVESHLAKDVADDDGGGDLGLLTGYQRTAVEIALGGRYPLGGSLRPAISAGLIVAPVSTWAEAPKGTSGTKPAPGLAFGWSLGVAARPASRLTLSLEYAGALRSVSFQGTADAPVDPAIEDARIKESFHAIGLTAGYAF